VIAAPYLKPSNASFPPIKSTKAPVVLLFAYEDVSVGDARLLVL
jgi:hypothetical protein